MAYITGLTRDKQEWTPQFIKSIDEETLHRLRSLLQGLCPRCTGV